MKEPKPEIPAPLSETIQTPVDSVAQAPDSPAAYFHLANALCGAGRLLQAVAAYQHAILLKPDFAEAHCNLGVAWQLSGDSARAAAAFSQAVALRPDFADAWYNLGVEWAGQGRIADAIDCYRRAIALQPGLANAHFNLGNALSATGQWTDAIEAYGRAVELNPNFAQAHSNAGMAWRSLGKMRQAIDAYEKAIALKPNWPEPRWNRALAHLLLGDFSRGWADFEYRPTANVTLGAPSDKPRWKGEDLRGKAILLRHEMGLGDTIQFARYAQVLAGTGVKVHIECQPALRELFQTLVGVDEVIATGQALPPHDFRCPLMSPPGILQTAQDTLPATCPYLHSDTERSNLWRSQLAYSTARLKVGLAWAGDARHQYDADRSIPLAAFAPLARTTDVGFFSLQVGAAARQTQDAGVLSLTDFTDRLHNMADTAALISQLDLVISVDSAVAHLAAALGKPVWLLLPFVPDWRWMLDRDDSPWYPSMCLYRQKQIGDWAGVIERVALDLRSK